MKRRWSRRPWLWSLGGLGAAAAVAVISIVVLDALTPVTPVSVGTAIGRFRAGRATPGASPSDTASDVPSLTPSATVSGGTPAAVPPTPTAHPSSRTPSPPQPVVPVEGVYTYATSGWETASALGGSRHDYPAETYLTIQAAGCGRSERWDVLSVRWDQSAVCPAAGGDTLRSYTTYHDFYNHPDRRDFVCDPGSRRRAAVGAPAGSTFGGRCVAGATTFVYRGVVVGVETLTIGGRPVSTVHNHITDDITGDQTGNKVRDTWIADSGLVVREQATTSVDTQQPVFGRVHYAEQYTITLENLAPRQ